MSNHFLTQAPPPAIPSPEGPLMVAIKAHFDGKVFAPDEPVNLPQGQSVTITPTPIPHATPQSPA